MFDFIAEQFVEHAWKLVVIAGLILCFSTLELLVPAEGNQTLLGRLRNFRFIAFYQLGGGIAVSVAAYWLVPQFVLPGSPELDRPALQTAGLVAVYLFVSDLVFYWYHRAQHAVPALWVLHELHHSDTELNVTTSLRTYLLERPIQFILISLPIAALVSQSPALATFHMSQEEARLMYVVSLTSAFFAHANVRLQLGRLSWIVTAPQLHRLHHSVEVVHQQKNFAQFFPILDVVFGTYRAPRPGEFPQTGTTGLASDVSVGRALRRPLQYWFRHFRRTALMVAVAVTMACEG